MKALTYSGVVVLVVWSWTPVNAQFGGTTASTPDAAAGQVMADMIRAEGVYNRMTAASMIDFEQARSKYIENQKQWVDVYLMKRRILAAEHADA